MAKNIDRTLVVKAVISKLNNDRPPDKIKVKNLQGYDPPDKIPAKVKEGGLIPDLTVHYGKELNLYEIELDDDLDSEKWKLMSLYSKKNQGYLFLVVPDYLKDRVKVELEKNEVNAGLIYFHTD